jgi:hypothetical protein
MYGGAKDLMASLGRDGAAIPRGGHACGGHAASEKGAVSAQKLGQLQPFDSRRECLGQLASLFWAELTPLSLQGKPLRWARLACSAPVLALLLCNVVSCWVGYTTMTEVPQYLMDEGFDLANVRVAAGGRVIRTHHCLFIRGSPYAMP